MRGGLTCLVSLAASGFILASAANAESALAKRGAYLVNGPMACSNCHGTRKEDFSIVPGKEFAGGFKLIDPAFEAYAANITSDKKTGIGGWTNAQIVHAIREGVDKEGHVIFPPMPVFTYNHMSNADVNAVVAYLRTVKAESNDVPESKWNVPQMAMPAAKGAAAPPKKDKVAYGGYIVNALAHCFECHTTPDEHGAPDFAHGLGAGGFLITLAPGMTVKTPNITSDPDTGIGKWSDADIKKALTEGVTPTGGHLSPPMPFPWFKNMTGDDLDAVVAYVRTIPPISNKVERTDFQNKAFPWPQ